MMETWDYQSYEAIQTPERMILFFQEIENICKKYDLSISHEDTHGAFVIEKYKEANIEWLEQAAKNYDENEVKKLYMK